MSRTKTQDGACSPRWRAWRRLGWTTLVLVAIWVAVVVDVNLASGPYRGPIQTLPHDKVAIVFGAYVLPGGQPSFILRDRLDAGVALYRAHKVDKLLMSGDNRVANYNEPDAMREYAISQGVPASDVVADYAGRDTYDTCYRAKHIFGLDSAILVTQNYHAPRAVYIARGLGLDAMACEVPDFERYPTLRLPYSAREYVADLKAWWDVNLGHRRAGVMGAPETSLAFGSARIHPRTPKLLDPSADDFEGAEG